MFFDLADVLWCCGDGTVSARQHQGKMGSPLSTESLKNMGALTQLNLNTGEL